MNSKRHPGYWGSAVVLDYLRAVFIHKTVPEDATAEDVLFWVNKSGRGQETGYYSWRPQRVLFVGPKQSALDFDGDRVLIFHDEHRKITSIALG